MFIKQEPGTAPLELVQASTRQNAAAKDSTTLGF